MQQLTIVLILALTVLVSAVRISTMGANPTLGEFNAEELTFKIRRLDHQEAARGNLYHHYLAHMARLNESLARADRAAEEGGPSVTEIVNIGKEIWDIIVKNQPTSDVKVAFGAAVPKAATDWHVLTNWKKPASEAYSIEYFNVYKATVVKFDYMVVYIYGGKYEGKGQYLTGVQIVPSNVDVSWGYNFACKVEIPQVLNVGDTPEDPIGGIQMNLIYTVETILNKNHQTKAWWVKGNGDLDEI